MSAMNSEASEHLSMGITEKAVAVFTPHYYDLTRARQVHILHNVDTIIRKLAHVSEYTVLGILMGFVSLGYRTKFKVQVWAAFLICTVYAISDETHQIVVAGRGPKVTDVLIDMCGAAIGIVFLQLSMRSRDGIPKGQSFLWRWFGGD